uniref:ALMS motif domain-containing protein n=1 Tax=Lepeophtheirus salmonis TaxID=72036 RepID=A0A0K2TCS8_LEPSM
MDLDISQGPLSDSSKEDEEEFQKSGQSHAESLITRLNLDEHNVNSEFVSTGFTEGLLLSSLVDSIHIESGTSRGDGIRGDLPRIHSDRSISPSVASSISVVSSAGGRRNLEWDSGADLGYIGLASNLSSKKPAVELSALEKLAIQNYKEILQTTPTSSGKSTTSHRSSAFRSYKRDQNEFEVEKLRLKKFGDFLLRNNDYFESTPSEIDAIKAPFLRSCESISPLSPIQQEKIRSLQRRSKSWTDLHSKDSDSILPAKYFKNLRGPSPVEPSSSSSTGTVIPFLQKPKSSELYFLPYSDSSSKASSPKNEKDILSLMDDQLPVSDAKVTVGSQEELEKPSLYNEEVNQIEASKSSTEPDDTKILKLQHSVKVTRSNEVNSTSNMESEMNSLKEANKGFPPTKKCLPKKVCKNALFKMYKKKLSHYIHIISTPSLTSAESKMKQKLAGKLMKFMKDEEVGCNESDSPHSTSSLKLEHEIQKLDKLERKLLKCVPSLSLYKSDISLTSDNSSVRDTPNKNFTLQISSSHTSISSSKSNHELSESGCSSSDTQTCESSSVAVANDPSQITSLTMTTSHVTQVLQQNVLHPDRQLTSSNRVPTKTSIEKDISYKSTDNILSLSEDDDHQSEKKSVVSNENTEGRSEEIRSSSRHGLCWTSKSDFGQTYPSPKDLLAEDKILCQKASFLPSTESEFKQTCPSYKDVALDIRSSSESSSSISSRSLDKKYYHSHRNTAFINRTSNVKMDSHCEVNLKRSSTLSQNKSTTMSDSRRKVNSFYSLEVSSKPPVNSKGNRMVSEKDFFVSKENRNIISNHIAGLNLGPIKKSINSHYQHGDSPPHKNTSLGLSDSLKKNYPSFLQRSRQRVKLLRESREERLIEQERKRIWLQNIATLSPSSKRRADISYVPNRVVRVFDYKEMVESTKRRCRDLPEVKKVEREIKKKQYHLTNRIMLDIYNRKVKQHLFKRRIRSAH